jgi:hypothetical protein
MSKKIVLSLEDDVVIFARKFDDKWLSKTTESFPYRTTDGLGNPLARLYRSRDWRIGRGINCDVMVIDGGGDPVDFLFKKYNKKSKSFTLNNESEAARIERVQMIRLRYNNGIEGINQVEDLDLIARAKKSIKKLPEGLYDSLNVRARKHEPLSNEELFTVESELSKMNTDDATFVVGFIAKNYSRICLDPGIGQEPQPRTLQHILATRQNAINWWVRLMGTPYEKYAKYELARIYIASKEEDKAM